jgi:hypothetical protein
MNFINSNVLVEVDFYFFGTNGLGPFICSILLITTDKIGFHFNQGYLSYHKPLKIKFQINSFKLPVSF